MHRRPPPLEGRTHIEIISGDGSLLVRQPGDDGNVSRTLIDPTDGAVIRRAGDTGVAPHVSYWSVRMAGGRTARVFLLTYPPGAFDSQTVNVSVIYRQFRDGRPVLALASSQFHGPQVSSLGESFDVSAFTRCAVRGGMLTLTGAGLVHAPFQANEAGGLRQLN